MAGRGYDRACYQQLDYRSQQYVNQDPSRRVAVLHSLLSRTILSMYAWMWHCELQCIVSTQVECHHSVCKRLCLSSYEIEHSKRPLWYNHREGGACTSAHRSRCREHCVACTPPFEVVNPITHVKEVVSVSTHTKKCCACLHLETSPSPLCHRYPIQSAYHHMWTRMLSNDGDRVLGSRIVSMVCEGGRGVRQPWGGTLEAPLSHGAGRRTGLEDNPL